MTPYPEKRASSQPSTSTILVTGSLTPSTPQPSPLPPAGFSNDKVVKKITTSTDSSGSTAAALLINPTVPSSFRSNVDSVNRVNFAQNDYQTQSKIQPTTYNPNRLKTSPKYNDIKLDKSELALNKLSNTARKIQKYEETQQQQSRSGNYNEFKEFVRVRPLNLQQPQPFQSPSSTTKSQQIVGKSGVEPQFYRSRNQNLKTNTNPKEASNLLPAPFSVPQQRQRGASSVIDEEKLINSNGKIRGGFHSSSRGRINFRASTQKEIIESYPTTTANVLPGRKGFLGNSLTKEKHTPTTFKPSTYKKTYDINGNRNYNQQNNKNYYYQTQQTVKPNQNSVSQQQQRYQSTNTVPTTANPYYNPDEDDGQYHPELYEIDFPRNRFNLQRSSTVSPTSLATVTSTSRNQYAPYKSKSTSLSGTSGSNSLKESNNVSDLGSDEDELFKTAHSLNFGAASINKLRADIIKAEKTSQQYNSQYNPSGSTSTTSTPPSVTSGSKITTFFTQSIFASTNSYTNPSYNYNANLETAVTTVNAKPRPTTISTSFGTTPTTTTSTTAKPHPPKKTGKSHKSSKHSEAKKNGSASKRPSHADEDTSYDYAYYDTDTLSESPQDYPEYEIAEFAKTKK